MAGNFRAGTNGRSRSSKHSSNARLALGAAARKLLRVKQLETLSPLKVTFRQVQFKTLQHLQQLIHIGWAVFQGKG